MLDYNYNHRQSIQDNNMNKLLINQLKEIGVKNTDTVIIHSALSKIKIDANEIIETLINYLNEGLLLMPAHTWATINIDNTLFDVNNEPSHVGLLTEKFRTYKNVKRSLHPTHSMAGYGKRASEYLKGAENDITPTNPKGAWGRLYDENAYVFHVGVGLERSTFMHAVEEVVDIPRRTALEPILITLKDGEKEIKKPFHRHYSGYGIGISNFYPRIEQELIDKNILKVAKFGEATLKYYRAKELQDYLVERLKNDPFLFEPDLNKIPTF